MQKKKSGWINEIDYEQYHERWQKPVLVLKIDKQIMLSIFLLFFIKLLAKNLYYYA